jgi:glutamine amidotransferase
MGWNYLDPEKRSLPPLSAHRMRFYFVHSYHVACNDPGDVMAWTSYGYDFASVIAKDNIVGVQFHPEKSHRYGMRFMQWFVEWDGRLDHREDQVKLDV